MDVTQHREVCRAPLPQLAERERYDVVNPLRHRTWTDGDGGTWRRRGAELLDVKRARRLLADDEVLIVHVHDGAPHLHVGSDRLGLVDEVMQVWDGRDPDPMHSFELGEYRDEAHRVLVMVVERC